MTVPQGAATPGRPEARNVGNSRREELDPAGFELPVLVAPMLSQSMPTCVMPTRVTAGRPGSGGATSAARVFDQFNDTVVLPKAHNRRVEDHR